jgi:hypothetical protein
MTKKLVVPVLALGLALFGGCGSSSSSNTGGSGGATGGSGGSTGGSGGSTGGSGGSTGGAGGSATGGAGGSTGGAGGSATDGGTADGSAVDGSAVDGSASDATAGDGGTAAAFCTGYVAGSGMLMNKAAADFCMEYSTVCGFGTDMRYTNMGDCVTKYGGASASIQTCRAGHLCNAAASDAAKTTHCPHATGLGAVAACNM